MDLIDFNIDVQGKLIEFCVAMPSEGWTAMRGYKVTVNHYQFAILPFGEDSPTKDGIVLKIVELTSGGFIEEVTLPSTVVSYKEMVDFIGMVVAPKLVYFILGINGNNPNSTNLDEQIEEYRLEHVKAYGVKPFTERSIEKSFMN